MHKQDLGLSLVVGFLVLTVLLAGCGGKTAPPTPAPEVTTVAAPTPVLEEKTPGAPSAEPGATIIASPTLVSPPALDGAALLQERCTSCHTLQKATSRRQDQAGWTRTVQRMITKGAELNTEEQAALIAYLAQTYGP